MAHRLSSGRRTHNCAQQFHVSRNCSSGQQKGRPSFRAPCTYVPVFAIFRSPDHQITQSPDYLISIFCIYSAMSTFHFSVVAMAMRNAAEAAGSPCTRYVCFGALLNDFIHSNISGESA